jgi:hypothetical protein
MATYVAVFRGRTLEEAKIVATSAHPAVIAAITEEFLRHPEPSDDPVLRAILNGERRALRLIARQCRAAGVRKSSAAIEPIPVLAAADGDNDEK